MSGSNKTSNKVGIKVLCGKSNILEALAYKYCGEKINLGIQTIDIKKL